MNNCDKFKKSILFSIVYWIAFFTIVVNKIFIFGSDLLSGVVIGFLGYFGAMPLIKYLQCLTDYNSKRKL